MHRFRPIPLLAIATFLLGLAACAGEPAASVAAEESAAAESHAGMSMAASEGDGGAGGDTVVISGFSFGDDITVAAGTTVTFQNDDDAAHTVTEGTDGTAAEGAAFDEEVAGGESVEITFDEAGTFDVTCRFHPDMQMTVTVE
jgi:plastocyanin